jgi:hypothetical protein
VPMPRMTAISSHEQDRGLVRGRSDLLPAVAGPGPRVHGRQRARSIRPASSRSWPRQRRPARNRSPSQTHNRVIGAPPATRLAETSRAPSQRIAVNERAPASTAHTASAKITASRWRIPRRCRGSATPASIASRPGGSSAASLARATRWQQQHQSVMTGRAWFLGSDLAGVVTAMITRQGSCPHTYPPAICRPPALVSLPGGLCRPPGPGGYFCAGARWSRVESAPWS